MTDDYDVIMSRNDNQVFYFTEDVAWESGVPNAFTEDPREKFKEFRSRKGRVVISSELMIDDIDLVRRMMLGLFVLRVEKSTCGDDEYFVCSDAFDSLPEGGIIPEYVANIDEETQVIEWVRRAEPTPEQVICAGLLSSLDNIRITLERDDDNDPNSPVRRAWIENGDDERVLFYEQRAE